MEKYEYFGGTPEVGIVPKAPHAGPLVRHVFEQEHGRGGFAGKVTQTYHLYPPTNWLAAETRTLDGRAWAPHWESPLRPVGGTHHALVAYADGAPVGIARLVRDGEIADVACAVADDWQSRGVGTVLMEQLAADARAAGIVHLRASMRAENRAPLALMRHVTTIEESHFECGELEVVGRAA